MKNFVIYFSAILLGCIILFGIGFTAGYWASEVQEFTKSPISKARLDEIMDRYLICNEVGLQKDRLILPLINDVVYSDTYFGDIVIEDVNDCIIDFYMGSYATGKAVAKYSDDGQRIDRIEFFNVFDANLADYTDVPSFSVLIHYDDDGSVYVLDTLYDKVFILKNKGFDEIREISFGKSS